MPPLRVYLATLIRQTDKCQFFRSVSISRRCFSSDEPSSSSSSVYNLSVQQCYELFCLDEYCSLEELRLAYEVTIKRATGGDAQGVQQLDTAYYRILKDRYRHEMHSDGTLDRKSFLNYEGVAKRTRRLEPIAANDEDPDVPRTGGYRVPRFKYTGSIDRMVETLVTKQFEKVDTSQLEGFGKPLPKHLENPYVDTLQTKLNEIMMKNDYSTEWLELQKEIKRRLAQSRTVLTERNRSLRLAMGGTDGAENVAPKRSAKQAKEWKQALEAFATEIKKINKRVDVFNLSVPVLRMQITHYDPDRELKKLQVSWASSKGEGDLSDRDRDMSISEQRNSTTSSTSKTDGKPGGQGSSSESRETDSGFLQSVKNILGF